MEQLLRNENQGDRQRGTALKEKNKMCNRNSNPFFTIVRLI